MPLVNFSNLDFDQIRDSIKSYLRSNSNFTDYDFEGSNLSTIIDTLAYNTYISSYNANMVTNEVFIDSATLRENVVSLARNIGYTPRSRKSSIANVSFVVDVLGTTSTTVTLKAGTSFVSSRAFGNESYIFSIPDDITVPVDSTGSANFLNIDIYEGTYIKNTYNVNSRTPNQKYIIPNSGCDTSLIRVIVKKSQRANQSGTLEKFIQYDNLYEIGPTSPIYFIEEIDSERYELLFGDGIFGKKLEEPNSVEVSYITSKGESGNNISNFTFSGTLRDNNNNAISSGISLITTNAQSYGGKSIESVESIKKYAPRIYAAQNRAVTSSDYEALIPQIYPESESVSAFGGEELTPPQYGKVIISIKPYNGVYLSSRIKSNILLELKKYTVSGIVPQIIDLKYLYLELDSKVYYNTNLAQSPSYVNDIVLQNITNYSNSSDLNKFGARFKYSKYLNIIDNSNDSVTSNITTVNIRRDLVASLNQFAEYEICFGNRFYIKNHGHTAEYQGTIVGYNIKSSGFTVSGISGTVYLGDIANHNLKTGTIFLFKLNSPTEPIIVKRSIGTIDYIKGEIKLNPIKILSTSVNKDSPLIEISATPYSNDVIGLQDLYLQLDVSSTTISMISDQIESGDDISGTNYKVSSSYSNGSLVRGLPTITQTTESSITPTTTTTQTPTTISSYQITPATTVVNSNNGSTTSTSNY
jgi:hypothetical protein